MQLILEVPDHLIDQNTAEFARRIKLYAALLMFQSNELSVGAATELVGVDRFIFTKECQRFGIPLVNYPAEDLRDELAALRGLDAVALVRDIRDDIYNQTKDMSPAELVEFFRHRTKTDSNEREKP